MNSSDIRKEIVNLMFLVATRRRSDFEEKTAELTKQLEKESAILMRAYFAFIKGLDSFIHNDYPDARENFNEVLNIVPNNHDLCGIANMGLGFTNRSAGHLDEAVTNLIAATELIDKDGDFQSFISFCFQSLGDIHVAIDEFNAAIDYFTKAHENTKGDDDKSALFRYHMGIGNCYLKMKEYGKSEYHYKEAIEIEGRPAPMVSRIQNDLGVLYLETKEFDKAEELLKKSLKIRQDNNLEDAACTTMSALAEVYLESNKAGEAMDLLKDCQVLVDKYRTDWKKVTVLQLMARTYSKMGNYQAATEKYEEYHQLFDKIRREQERNILKFKNEQIESQRKMIEEKHQQLAATLEEVKRLKVNRRAVVFSWLTIIVLVVISEVFLDPIIESYYAYNDVISLLVKVGIALLFKPIDGMYANILWKRTLREV